MAVKNTQTRPDSLGKTLVANADAKLELKRLGLTGTGAWIFDGGAGRKFNWLSFTSTKPNQNIYFRDDFRDNNLEAWTIVGGTWQGLEERIKATGTGDWHSNRIRTGSLNWQGLDVLFRSYFASGGDGGCCNIFLRCDTGIANVNAYYWGVGSVYIDIGRIVNGEVAQWYDLGTPVLSLDTWFWVRTQIYDDSGDVVMKLKWWPVGEDEPGAWKHSYTWTGIWRSSGCLSISRDAVGMGPYDYYDDFLLSRKEGIPSPANCSVSFKFWPSNDESNWGSEYTDITKVPNSRFLKIEATLSRTSLLSAMPTIEDMTLGYRVFAQPIFI